MRILTNHPQLQQEEEQQELQGAAVHSLPQYSHTQMRMHQLTQNHRYTLFASPTQKFIEKSEPTNFNDDYKTPIIIILRVIDILVLSTT